MRQNIHARNFGGHDRSLRFHRAARLAMHALGGLQIVNGDVNAPGAEGVRDYMLRYMGQVFVGGAFGPALGHAFGFIVSIVFALLLLSAVNTAIVDLITIQFLMSRDREMPKIFQRLNKWGVPSCGMVLATIVPMLLVLLVKDMAGLADLYAVGVVGAIATNLGATSTDRKLSIKTWERDADVRDFSRHGGDRNIAAHRQTERALFRGHHSRCRIDSARARSGTPDEKGSAAASVGAGTDCQLMARPPAKRTADAIRRRIDSVRNPRRWPHTRFRIARSAESRRAPLSALRARTAVHDRAGCETQMAGRSRGSRDFRAKRNKRPAISSHFLLMPSVHRRRNDCRCCGDTRRIARDSRCAATQCPDQSSARQRHSRSLEFAAGRNRPAGLCVKMDDNFDLRSLRKHVERCDRIDRKSVAATLSNPAQESADCRKRKSMFPARDRLWPCERLR